MNINNLIEVLFELHESLPLEDQHKDLSINGQRLLGIATSQEDKTNLSIVVEISPDAEEVLGKEVPAPTSYYFVNTFNEATKVAMPQGICALGFDPDDNSVLPYKHTHGARINGVKWVKYIDAL